MTNCELITTNGHSDFNLCQLKRKLWILQILLSVYTGLIGGVQFSFNRGMTICFGLENGLQLAATYIYLCIAGIGALLELFTINKAMHLYKQIQVIPIYETSLIMLNLFCGCIILDEKSMYFWYEIISLMMCACIQIFGIFLMIKKP